LGQILVKDVPATSRPLQALSQNRKSSKPLRPMMDDPVHGVRATLIDLGLSRMDAGDGSGGEKVHWTPFEEEIFEGEGRSFRLFVNGARSFFP
jgi:serine/threonine-protein kinase haspin